MGVGRNPASLTEEQNKWEMERGGDREEAGSLGCVGGC